MGPLASEIPKFIDSILENDVSVTSTSTTNTGLSVELEANSVYAVEGILHIGCSGAAGVSFGVDMVTGWGLTKLRWGRTTSSSASVFATSYNSTSFTSAVAYNAQIGTSGNFSFHGTLKTTTEGTFSITFQSVNGAQTPTVYSGSILSLRKIS